MSKELATSSTRPYFIRALHEWCCANGLTPYVAVRVDGSVQVPNEFVKDDEIVLNISPDATSSLKLGNDFIEFKARFGGVAREVVVPIEQVMAIYARENGQGMAFPMEAATRSNPVPAHLSAVHAPATDLANRQAPELAEPLKNTGSKQRPPPAPKPNGPSGRPSLKRVK